MNADIEKTHIFHKMEYDFKGHQRTQLVIFVFRNQLFVIYNFCLKADLNKILYEL